jgi:predicted nucleotidyltransferase component of viral defense system
MLLHKDKNKLADAIRATANAMSMPISYIEKDYWITMALKALAQSTISDDIVFKGGTSLSKAFRLISRFSEDVDIAVITSNLSTNQTKNKVKAASKIVSRLYQKIESDDNSTNSHFRKIRFAYLRIDDAIVEGQVTDSILLEVNAFADPEPYSSMYISSYIADYFKSIDLNDVLEAYELMPFKMNVLCLNRTICEKIMALIKASYGENQIAELKNKIRHLYDIYFLMTDETTQTFVLSNEFNHMINKVADSDRAAFPIAPWLNEPLSNADVFADLTSLWPALEGTYYGDFKAMVVDSNMPTKDMLIGVTTIIHERLLSL